MVLIYTKLYRVAYSEEKLVQRKHQYSFIFYPKVHIISDFLLLPYCKIIYFFYIFRNFKLKDCRNQTFLEIKDFKNFCKGKLYRRPLVYPNSAVSQLDSKVDAFMLCYISVFVVSRPPPPVVGKVTHYSIELFWNEALDKAKEEVGGKEMVKVCVQEQDRHNTWGNVYT